MPLDKSQPMRPLAWVLLVSSVLMLSTFPYMIFSKSDLIVITSRASESAAYKYIWFTLYFLLAFSISWHWRSVAPRLVTLILPSLILISGALGYMGHRVEPVAAARLLMYGSTILFAFWAANRFTRQQVFDAMFLVGCITSVLFWALYPFYSGYTYIYDQLGRTNLLGLSPYAAPFAHKNLAGGFFALCIVIGLVRISDRAIRTGPVHVLFLALMTLCLLMTGAINPVVSLFAVLPLMPLLLFIKRDQRLASLYFVLASIATALTVLVASQVLSLFGRDLGFTGRSFLVEVFPLFYGRRPLTGYGYDQFFADSPLAPAVELMSLQPWHTFYNFESSYLQILIDFGLIGFVLFIILLAGVCIRSWRLAMSTADFVHVTPLLLAAYLIVSSFGDTYLGLHNCLVPFVMFFLYFSLPPLAKKSSSGFARHAPTVAERSA